MAFQQQQNLTIVGYGEIRIDLVVPDVDNELGAQLGTVTVELKYSDSTKRSVQFDLLARLGDDAAGITHRNNLLAMKNYIIARIEAEVIP